ncbi:MAG: hypothetical protein ACPGRX_08860 [Bdellovibrionales bacterium]
MKDGKPAGIKLMNLDEIKIAIIDTYNDGNSKNFITPEIQDEFRKTEDSLLLESLASFPVEMEGIFKRAIGFWTDADIKFVSYKETPDIIIFAFDNSRPETFATGGRATFPLNDNKDGDYSGFSQQIIALPNSNISLEDLFSSLGLSFSDDGTSLESSEMSYEGKLFQVARHEFGHVFGILHPFDAVDFVGNHHNDICSLPERNTLNSEADPGVMSYEAIERRSQNESFYDRGTREFVRTGNAPTVGSIKP